MATTTPSPDTIICAAIEIASAEERAAYISRVCGDDNELRGRVEKLVTAHFRAGSFLEAPAPQLVATIDEATTERPGTVIGLYKLLEQIGEGGFGVVFMAEQQQPVRRKVALKVIKPGMDTRQVIARFEAERQALALMDHPNIARVLDAGTTNESSRHTPCAVGDDGTRSVPTTSGRPYFVMELVRGPSMTDYCDQHNLPVRERLALFIDVCQAVQHAHQKGIIHRDIKPSNVLVTLHDGKPVVKVIDFGIAKAMGQQLTDKTLFTNFAQMIGTPLYMSPEQAEMSGLDVDTRSDIYSLGVLLYELLTGTTPFDKERLKSASFDEIRRIIREEEPPKPSTRMSTLGLAATTASEKRGTDPRKLSRLFRGELDWIVMKALEKDRNRRYETASAFAADVGRYLQDEAVQACPPSVGYRLGKFARRNKAALGMSACVLAVVIALAGSAVWFGRVKATRRTETERGVTVALAHAETLVSEGDKQIDHPERWQATAQLALAAQEKAEELLAAGEGTEEIAGRVRQVRLAVDEAVTDSRLLVELDRIRLEQTAVNSKKRGFDIARAAPLYAQLLGDYGVDPAAPEAAAARVRDSRLREALLSALADWAQVAQDKGEQEQVERVYQLAVPPDSIRTRLLVAVRRRNGAELVKLMQEPSFHHVAPASLVLSARELAYANEWVAAEQLLRAGLDRRPGDFWLNHDLGDVLLNQQPSRVEEAVRYQTAALALRSDSPLVHLKLALSLQERDVEGAISLCRAALQIDPMYADAHSILGRALRAKGDLDQAVAEFRKAIELDPKCIPAHLYLGLDLLGTDRWEEAIGEFRKVIQIEPKLAVAHSNLSAALLGQGMLDEAVAEGRKAIELDPKLAGAHSNFGLALIKQEKLDEAVAECRKATELEPKLAWTHTNLGVALGAQGRSHEAIAEYRTGIEIDPKDAKAHFFLGYALQGKGQPDEAIAEYREAIRFKKDYPDAHYNLGLALQGKGQLDEAIAEYREAIRIKEDYPEAHCNLGNALCDKGQPDEAIDEYRAAIRSKQNYPEAYKAHGNLGIRLALKGRWDEAIAEYREAIRLHKDYPETHCNLGNALMSKGEFREAVEELRLGHQLGSRNPRWPYPSAQWLRKAERLADLDARLPDLLKGQERPKDAAECLVLAELCWQHKGLFAAAARWYGEAFAAEPKLADDPHTLRRYNAACTAIKAACGEGKDAAAFDDQERARLRRQALAWLQADLAGWCRLLEENPDQARAGVQGAMQWRQQDTDLAGVRSAALAKLPEGERQPWQQLWQDIDDLLKRAQGKPVPPKK
jgi:serine/threonine protein kinase/tetratricopeptide (TPR) repeat protein